MRVEATHRKSPVRTPLRCRARAAPVRPQLLRTTAGRADTPLTRLRPSQASPHAPAFSNNQARLSVQPRGSEAGALRGARGPCSAEARLPRFAPRVCSHVFARARLRSLSVAAPPAALRSREASRARDGPAWGGTERIGKGFASGRGVGSPREPLFRARVLGVPLTAPARPGHGPAARRGAAAPPPVRAARRRDRRALEAPDPRR